MNVNEENKKKMNEGELNESDTAEVTGGSTSISNDEWRAYKEKSKAKITTPKAPGQLPQPGEPIDILPSAK